MGVKIRPFTSKETETKLNWDMTSDFDVDGYQVATSDFVDQYTAHDAKKGKIQKLFIAEIKCSDGSMVQIPVVETKEETVKKEVAQTKLVSKPKLPNEKLHDVIKTVVNVRPYTSKETETQVTWDDTSDFVEQYTADKAEEGKIQRFFIAEIGHTDGTIFQVPVIKDKEEKAKKETAQTKLVSKQKLPIEKLHSINKTEVKIRPFTSKETETKLKWDMATDFDVDGYQLATSDFVDQYTAQDAKKGKIQKLFVAEIKSSDGSISQIPVVESKKERVKKEITDNHQIKTNICQSI